MTALLAFDFRLTFFRCCVSTLALIGAGSSNMSSKTKKKLFRIGSRKREVDDDEASQRSATSQRSARSARSWAGEQDPKRWGKLRGKLPSFGRRRRGVSEDLGTRSDDASSDGGSLARQVSYDPLSHKDEIITVRTAGADYTQPASPPASGNSTFEGVDNITTYTTSSTGESPMVRRQVGERARYNAQPSSRGVKRKFRVRPYHCFADNPLYLTEEDLYNESLTATKRMEFLDSYLVSSSKGMKSVTVESSVEELFGSPKRDGRIGSLRCEVLGCVSLDRQKPDVAVYMVCGDAAYCTDTIQGYRSPMWPTGSRRGAVFPLHHAYVKLYVGVFDTKGRKNKENDVFCGRVVVDVSALRPGTEYDITFPLRASSFVYDRRKRGVIRLRFSVFWFSERAAILSYFRGPESMVASCPLVEGYPAIPCAEPKTFRNVAITAHGQDLPGKYSRHAFRATMREFNLYQMNLRHLLKSLVVDAILYENKLVSLYLFATGLHCVQQQSPGLAPAYFLGYVLIKYIQSYQHFVSKRSFNFGYKPLTIMEVLNALLTDGKKYSFNPVLILKRAKRRGGGRAMQYHSRRTDVSGDIDDTDADDGEIEALDHREFPFSDRDLYPKFGVEDALAPSKNAASRTCILLRPSTLQQILTL